MDKGDILIAFYFSLITLFIFIPCIILCVAALSFATSVCEVCYLVFLILGIASIDGGLWWLLFI